MTTASQPSVCEGSAVRDSGERPWFSASVGGQFRGVAWWPRLGVSHFGSSGSLQASGPLEPLGWMNHALLFPISVNSSGCELRTPARDEASTSLLNAKSDRGTLS